MRLSHVTGESSMDTSTVENVSTALVVREQQ